MVVVVVVILVVVVVVVVIVVINIVVVVGSLPTEILVHTYVCMYCTSGLAGDQMQESRQAQSSHGAEIEKSMATRSDDLVAKHP